MIVRIKVSQQKKGPSIVIKQEVEYQMIEREASMIVEYYNESQLKDYLKKCSEHAVIDLDDELLIKLLLYGEQEGPYTPSVCQGIVGTTFVPISDIGIDFIAFIMCNGPADYVMYCLDNKSFMYPGIALSTATAYFVYSELKKVVKLTGYEYCIYKQAVTHFKRHEDFSLEDMRDWLPIENKECNMHHNKLYCKYRVKDLCQIKTDDKNLYNEMEKMQKDKILKAGKREGTFRLNY